MPYDEGLAERLRALLEQRDDVDEKRMFGGLAFMLHGNMCIGIVGDRLMARVGKDRHDELVSKPHASVMDFTGKPMKGFIYVAPEGIEDDADLKAWLGHAVNFADSLPPK